MTTDAATLDSAAIQALFDGFDPVDRQQLELLARIPPEKRVLAGRQAQAVSRQRAGVSGYAGGWMSALNQEPS